MICPGIALIDVLPTIWAVPGQITKACGPDHVQFCCKLVYRVIFGVDFDFLVVKDITVLDHQIEASKN